MNGNFRRVSAGERINQLASVDSSSRAESLGRAYKRVLKYRNKPVVVDGIRFMSRKEARIYGELKLRKKVGDIKDFTLQPKFPLLPKNDKFRAVHYVADFLVLYHNGKEEVWDVKGYKKDKVYLLKKKMMYWKHNVLIVEK